MTPNLWSCFRRPASRISVYVELDILCERENKSSSHYTPILRDQMEWTRDTGRCSLWRQSENKIIMIAACR